ncbi:NAD-specific glutamate dehydrogenase, large form [hydrothermal vent metagenome]|uniref:NAD-specific glutamate dehydrogenase, large form n=1 Tax=hydrothermal vent metagenome TaxID=652676 RepID=A0A3B0ZHP5_9ZZZZ
MLHLNEDKQEAIQQVIARINDKLPTKKTSLASAFTEKFYESTAPDDILERSTLNLYGAALAQWNIAYKRLKNKKLLHVYNPKMDEHGWQSTHTVIEIVIDDMPFLVDSISMALNQLGLTIHLIIHPVMHVVRDTDGMLQSVANAPAKNEASTAEAVLHFEVDRRANEKDLNQLEARVKSALDDVRVAVADWKKMSTALQETIQHIKDNPPTLDQDEINQDLEFLEWLARNHFTFLGYREYCFSPKENREEEDVLRIVPGSGLGILRTHMGETTSRSFAHLPSEVKKRARKPSLLIITKSNSRSTVHRPGYLDYVGIKRFNAAGEVVGEWRFLGLYTSSAYTSRIKDIPLLRQKEQRIMEGTGYRSSGHSAKALVNIIETLPRDELFQCTTDELYTTASAILHLQERQRVRLLVRQDPYGRFLSCLVFLPRERFNTENRIKIQNILRSAFNASSIDFSVSLSESVLARLYFIAHTEPGALSEYDVNELEKKITNSIRSWEDDLLNSLLQELGEENGTTLFARYAKSFPASYREDYPAPAAVSDILKIEELMGDIPIAMSLYVPLEATEGEIRFKIFRRDQPIYLSVILPMLENMGVTVIDERPHEVKSCDEDIIWVHDVGMSYDPDKIIDLDHLREFFQNAFAQIWTGNVENDGFNRLVLGAQLPWRNVVILRACYKYLRQTGFPFSQKYIEQALCKHPQIASLLVDLFHARLNPKEHEYTILRTKNLNETIEQLLDQVPSLDDDRILRQFFILIQAVLRTNFYQQESNGAHKDYISFKLDPSHIPGLPKPVPMYEIFVYSVHTEGVHLRGGKVSRGGLRWSDRMEDFRTEIFGLMKTQMVKNSIIVPVGAKGGFVLKKLPTEGDANALKEAVARSYRTFIRGLLDITDNLQEGKVVPPLQVVRYDGDDPYLVVAADKGTATFSDTANSIAKEYDFWLGDAFASGGSAGYDHKKMGITARGAWESVKHHFRERAIDIQKTNFTVMGIGGMNGDVFGNGMLLSEHIKLIGTFNHKHIFLDPDPDTKQSFQERKRLFHLARSEWTDYKASLISKGGGVYMRDAKAITISPQVQKLLAITKKTLTPNELIQALLKAPVDLIWNGGIGTFIKAKFESHAHAGDRSNDSIRINASELRCKAFGEGGNLGLTANARIEFSRKGGYINTDFIDNSGGVDCSDHEVNIKILLNEVVKNGDLSEVHRNQLLVEMTDEVAQLVLANSYQQAQALSSTHAHASLLLDEHTRFICYLEKSGYLERSTWNLPDDESINKLRAAGEGLTRPELAVLLSYAKINLYDALLASDIYSDAYLANEIKYYFPKPIQERYSELLPQHRLRREIIATFNANTMINSEGITFLFRVMENTGAKAPDVTRAYVVAKNIFGTHHLRDKINELDNKISARDKSELLEITRKLTSRATEWFLRNCTQPLDISLSIQSFQASVHEISKNFFDMLDPEERNQLETDKQRYIDAGVPDDLAATIASLLPLYSALDITEVASTVERPILTVAKLYFELGTLLDIHWLRDLITDLSEAGRWPRLARAALRNDLFRVHRTITREALLLSDKSSDAKMALDQWQEVNKINVHQYMDHLENFKSSNATDLALLTVAINEARKLIRGTGKS